MKKKMRDFWIFDAKSLLFSGEAEIQPSDGEQVAVAVVTLDPALNSRERKRDGINRSHVPRDMSLSHRTDRERERERSHSRTVAAESQSSWTLTCHPRRCGRAGRTKRRYFRMLEIETYKLMDLIKRKENK